MAAHRRPPHTQSRRVEALFKRLEGLLRQCPPDRLEAFGEYLGKQVRAEQQAEARARTRRGRGPGPISDAVRRAIRGSGLSVFALARASGVSQPALSRFVRGERDMTLGTLDKLANTLKLELRRKQAVRR